ncbi:MAG: hypothetical protein GX638_04075 [Crenarchaeota archaeon]|nr:hypothetical protein [Thermoproteota archaeon]
MDGFSFKSFSFSAGGEAFSRIKNAKEFMSLPASKSSIVLAYAGAAINVGHTIYSYFLNDPAKRAEKRGYSLR